MRAAVVISDRGSPDSQNIFSLVFADRHNTSHPLGLSIQAQEVLCVKQAKKEEKGREASHTLTGHNLVSEGR